MTIPAQVVQIGSKIGIKGVSRVRCKVMEGRDKDKILIRNVVGPVKIGDVILLKETSMESESHLARR